MTREPWVIADSDGELDVPAWADAALCSALPMLRAKGEGQSLEYMASFPAQARDLAKEVAAFATSNRGLILIGVGDKGELLGLPLQTPEARDEMTKRVEGICSGTIRPPVTPEVRFAIEADKVVMALEVQRGPQPVYYCQFVPYIRHLSQSRPADPQEVIDRVVAHTREGAKADGAVKKFYSSLATSLHTLQIYADQFDQRAVNPCLDDLRHLFRNEASTLRELAANPIAVQKGLSHRIEAVATAVDAVPSVRQSLGSGPTTEAALKSAVTAVDQLHQQVIEPIELAQGELEQARETIASLSRKLGGLGARAEGLLDQGRVDELKSEASDTGRMLLAIAHHKVDGLGNGVRQDLRKVGRDLHLIETVRLYHDGGQSQDALVARVRAAADELARIVSRLTL